MHKIKNALALLNPLYWPAWLGLSLLWICTQLPSRFRYTIGVALGRILYLLPSELKRTTLINLQLCFPDYPLKERQRLAKNNFASLGLGLIESAMAWWLPDKQLADLYHLHGMEHYLKATQKGKGVLLIAPHATCIEIVGRLLGMHYTFGVMYRPHKKAFINFIHDRFRKKHYVSYIPRHNMRALLRALANQMPIWYAYDVDGGRKRSIFAPFFGIPTASLTAVSRIANLSQAAIVPISYYRRDHNFFYDVYVHPEIEPFPSDDQTMDLTKLNAHLETAIRKKPEQYVWQYKRFKTRPLGEKRFYSKKNNSGL